MTNDWGTDQGTVKGWYKINTAAVSQPKGNLKERASRSTGESRMVEVEKVLRAQGIEFVEDFDSDGTVIVRYGAYADDDTWTAYQKTQLDKTMKEITA